MLRTLLGHWKDHSKKPSLLPEDVEVHFEDPTTVNPLFEDSDSSITSITRPADVNIDVQRVAVLELEKARKDDKDFIGNKLVDLSPPRESFLHSAQISRFVSVKKTNAGQDDEVSKKVGENSLQSRFRISENNQLKGEASNTELEPIKNDRNFSTVLENQVENGNSDITHANRDDIELIQVGYSKSDEKTNLSQKSEAQKTLLETSENMRLYQPPASATFNDKKSTKNNTELQKDQFPDPIHIKIKKVETIDEKHVKTGVLKNNNSHKTTVLEKAHASNEELEKPAQLRAKAIQELIKKFQGAPSENGRAITKTTQSEENVNLSHAEEKEKNLNTFKDVNDRKLEFNASQQPSTSSKSAIEKEALSNIFKFPPPPPIENLKTGSRLHGRVLLKKSNPTSPNQSTSEKVVVSETTLKESEQGKTRSDSSLERTRTTSSAKLVEHSDKVITNPNKETKVKIQQPALAESFLHSAKSIKVCPTKDTKLGINGEESRKLEETSMVHVNKHVPERGENDSQLLSKDNNLAEQLPTIQNAKIELVEVKTSNLQESSAKNIIPNKNEDLGFEAKANTSFSNEIVNKTSARLGSPAYKLKSSLSKSSSKIISNKGIDILKSHSEDSGITRGDQISSDLTLENEPNDSLETNSVKNPVRSKREKKLKSIDKKHCKKCKHIRNGSISLKKNKIDDYYDILTGAQHGHCIKHSDSYTSDLSWDEREILGRLQGSHVGTVRSNTPSTRSRNSRHTVVDNFRRLHVLRRSSDESSFYQASVCSCDKCWSRYVRDYAYTTSSLRGMPPIYEICTCRSSHPNFLGRRVKFHTDTIPEISASVKNSSTITPVPKTDSKHDNSDTDDASSNLSSRTKDEETVSQNPDGTKKKKITFSEKGYRIVTPWELEEWNHFKKREEIKKRRKRARYMGLMALAMVVFVGFVVTILMVYLRRKVL